MNWYRKTAVTVCSVFLCGLLTSSVHAEDFDILPEEPVNETEEAAETEISETEETAEE